MQHRENVTPIPYYFNSLFFYMYILICKSVVHGAAVRCLSRILALVFFFGFLVYDFEATRSAEPSTFSCTPPRYICCTLPYHLHLFRPTPPHPVAPPTLPSKLLTLRTQHQPVTAGLVMARLQQGAEAIQNGASDTGTIREAIPLCRSQRTMLH